jgi:hypothetical protein
VARDVPLPGGSGRKVFLHSGFEATNAPMLQA